MTSVLGTCGTDQGLGVRAIMIILNRFPDFLGRGIRYKYQTSLRLGFRF